MLLVILLALAVAVNFALGRLLYRATQRLLQFDDIFQSIHPVLSEYSDDLKRMSSGDLDGILVDHPEILAFHRRNLAARVAVESIVDSVTKTRPERKKKPRLPRPDME